MSRQELILREDAVRATEGGLDVEVRIPWYRSLPASSLIALQVSVDGRSFQGDDLTLTIGDTDYAFADLAGAWDHVWFVQDPAVVHLRDVHAEPGSTVTVAAEVGLRFPYIIIDGVGPLERYTDFTREVVVGESRTS